MNFFTKCLIFLFFCMTTSYADIYATKQGNVTYYSDVYSAGAVKVQNQQNGVTITNDASSLNSNVKYPTAVPSVRPQINLVGLTNGQIMTSHTPLQFTVVMQKLPNVKAVLFVDGVSRPIAEEGIVVLKDLTPGDHTIYAKLYDDINPDLAQSAQYTIKVQDGAAKNSASLSAQDTQ